MSTREHLMRHLWARVMLDSRAAGGPGFDPYRGVSFVAEMLGASTVEVGLAVGGEFLTGERALPSREVLARDAASLSPSTVEAGE